MRFLLYDRVASIEKGLRIETVKCVSLSEEYLRGHFPRAPLVPASLVLEMMAQTLGRLVLETHGFAVTPFLSLAEDVVLPHRLTPGREIRILAEMAGTNPKGTVGRAECRIDGRVVASAGRILYGHHPTPDPESARRRFAHLERTA